jgi:DNA-binding response OmpR family regulator
VATVVRQKILIIDDDQNVREMLRRLLEASHYTVVTAEDGPSGLESTKVEQPDLVVVDGLLPKMHGFLVCKAIKELENPPKVVLFTGVYTRPNYRWEATRSSGADDLVAKGSKPIELIAAIKRLLPERAELDTFGSKTQEREAQIRTEIAAPEVIIPAPIPVAQPADEVNFALLGASDLDVLWQRKLEE